MSKFKLFTKATNTGLVLSSNLFFFFKEWMSDNVVIYIFYAYLGFMQVYTHITLFI